MNAAGLSDPFRPFVVVADDGARLVLERHRSATGWLLRLGMYVLLLLLVVMLVLVPWAALTRGNGIGDLAVAGSFMISLYLILRLLLFGFHIEGMRRIVVERGRLTLVSRGVVKLERDEAFGVVVFIARVESSETEHGSVRWLRLQARTHGRVVELGTLHLDPEGEPTREAAARAAAATIAERLAVPLEFVGEGG
ncbi:hypothetical protein [Nannocystis radixulma]|uniref:DUF304 domain-containing protein n=1 Tax=Nannocystis radixulma TaxID=2995305 RepID=A0ABT5BMK9_9BACT|nr:hypothetical protein [Nannocystis radixulma]MDC0674800.1 hypothetical protein [Nannocystis radixulma]